MKILFLDIDGVLNSLRTATQALQVFGMSSEEMNEFAGTNEPLDKECIARLNKITKSTNAKIVISSSWRYTYSSREEFPILVNFLKACGVEAEVIDRTPVYNEYISKQKSNIIVESWERGKEIQFWLDKHPEVVSFVIVDDSNDMVHLMSKLVRTNSSLGIQDRDVEKAINILNNQ